MFKKASLSLLLLLAVTEAHTGVSDSVVRKWVSAALTGQTTASDDDAIKQIRINRSSTAVYAAWKLLKECRDAGRSLDLDLASAEHYLFIRAFAAEKGEQDVEGLPQLYGKLKETLGPAANFLKTSDQPVSNPDANVVRWGNSGVEAGLLDYTAATGKKPKPKTGAFDQYRLAVEGYYANYTASVAKPSCKVKPESAPK